MSLTITIPGAVDVTTGSMAPAVLTIGVGVPGAAGPQGPAGPGVPAGGTSGQYLQKIDGTNYNTDWVTLNLSAYLTTSAAASTYYLQTNPAGYITSAALSPYLTSATAASTYQTLAGMSSYLTTASAASTYAPIAAGQPTSGTIGQVLTKNSGTNYDSSWQTLIPGDRYLTSSTTSLTIDNNNKTLTIGTGLSYSSQQDIVITYDASNHMHARVLTYNSGTGVMTVDVLSHSGAGTYASWTVNVGGAPALASVVWGDITGTLGNQTDLATALNGKVNVGSSVFLNHGNAFVVNDGGVYPNQVSLDNGGLDIRDGTTFATVAEFKASGVIVPSAGITFSDASVQTSAGLSASTAASTYAPIASPTFTGTVTIPSGASIAGFAPLASPALTGNVTITSNSTGPALFIEQAGTGNILTLHDQATDTNFVAIDANGKVSTIPSEATNGAGFNIAHGVAPTTPVNGDIWTTTSGLFARINAGTKQLMNLGDTQTVSGNITFSNASSTYGSSTATGTINVASGATISASTKTVNVATGGVVGSTTLTTIGPVLGASTTSIGGTTAASTLNLATGATLTATTKAVNIGTAGVAGSTTNIVIGSTTGTSTTTLQGITNGVTEAVDTNNTELATTAFVVGQAGSATPLVNGTAAVGTSLRYARQDHVHGTDTTRAAVNSQVFTGTPSLPTGTTAVTQTAGNNTTAVATTAFVTAAVPAAATHTQALQFSSTSAFTKVIDASSQLIAPSVIKVWPSPSNYNGTATSGAGASAALFLTGYVLTSPSAGVAGNARAYHGNIANDVGYMMWGGSSNSQINFSRRVSMAFRFSQFPSSTASVTRVLLGKIHGAAVGDLTSAGIGVKYVPNGANFDFQLQVHNGTTLTSVTSSTQYAGGVADLEVVSDGAGNAILYLNGASVATTTGAPTGVTAANATVFAEVDSTASTANQPVASVGRLYVNTLNF